LLRECNFGYRTPDNRLRSGVAIGEDHDVEYRLLGRTMCGRGLRRSPTRPRLNPGKRGDQLHRMEREGAIGKRDSADPARNRRHAVGEELQALRANIPAQAGNAP